jgi:hypothetical protein
MSNHVYKLALGLALGLVACGGATSSQWDAQAATALHAQPEAMLHDLDTGNFDAMLAMLDDAPTVLDLDENNQPVRYDGRDKVTEYMRSLEKGMKAQGLKFHSTIQKNDCRATDAIGYCVVEFDQTISAGGQTMGPFKFRATFVGHKVGSDWRLTQWHGSFREAPAPSPSPSGAAAPANAAK